MDLIAVVVLVLSVTWLAYTYFGYPLLLKLVARRRPPVERARDELPHVTVVTAAYDEVDVIGATIANKLESDYPADRLDVMVVSDGSTDGTDDVVRGFEQSHPGRVRLIRQEPRQGKTAGLNLVVPEARGEIVVFADANSIYEPDAIRHLVAAFDDPAVGYVTGKMIYVDEDGSITGDGCTAYMRYENALRALETDVGSVVGVDGGIDAVRRDLYRPMRADQLPDFVLPLRVVEQGYRVAYEPRAVLREEALTSSEREYRMRVRVTLRALWALLDHRGLFDPFRHPVFSWQLASHKLLRYGAFLPQALAFLANAVLLPSGQPWTTLFVLQVLFYVLAGIGYRAAARGGSSPLTTAPYYLTLLNVACAHATWKFLRGEKQVLWQPRVG